MKLQKCDHCHTPFTWREINKSLWLAYRPITCRKCGTKHKIQGASRFVLAIVAVPTTLIAVYVINNYNLSLYSNFILLLVLITFISSLFPYLVKYSDDY